MPERTRVDAFIDVVVNGDHAEAIENFYHTDASMQENLSAPRCGRDHLVAHEKAALARVKAIETLPPKALLVDGDKVVIQWVFIMTAPNGERKQLEELSIQDWRGDRIMKEQFFYDSATAWTSADT